VDERIVYQNLTHEILGFVEPCFETFGDSLYIVEIMRHPGDMVNSWIRRGWGEDRFGWDPRSFIISFNYKGRQIPYFAESFKESYHDMSPVERVIQSINACQARSLKTYAALSTGRKKRILFVQFEQLVTDSKKELDRIRDFLDLEEGENLEKVMNEQRCPRTLDFTNRNGALEKFKDNASASAIDLLYKMIHEYETFNFYAPDANLA
jgi:hypothetical protein